MGDDSKVDVTKEGIIDNDLAPGIAPLESPLGANDPSEPVAEVHDLEFDAHMLGLPNDGITDTTLHFDEGEAEVEGKSLFGVITAPIYAVLATVIGVPLWIYEGITGKSPDKKELVEENPQIKSP